MKALRNIIAYAVISMGMTFAAHANSSILCESENGKQHVMKHNSTVMTVHGENFNFEQTGTLKSGADVFVYWNQERTKLLAVTSADKQTIVYQIMDKRQRALDMGTCN